MQPLEDGGRGCGGLDGFAGGPTAFGDKREKEIDGGLLAGEGEGGEERGAKVRVAGEGVMLFEQEPRGFSAGLGDREGGLSGGVVGCQGMEEAGGPRDGGGAVQAQDARIASAKEFGFAGPELGAEAEQESGGVGADLLDGASGVDLDGELFVGEEWGEVGEDVAVGE